VAKLTLKIKINGREKNTNVPVERVKVHREINKIPSAEITFIDSKSNFKDEFVSLGTAISIEATQGKSKLTFNGNVTSIKLKMDESLKLVIVTLKYGPANALVNKVRTEVHSNKQDGTKLKSLYQYNCSDWDFLISMADLHSRWVIVNESATSDGKIKFFYEEDGEPYIGNDLSDELVVVSSNKQVEYNFKSGEAVLIPDIEFAEYEKDKKLPSSKIAVLGVNNNSSMIEVYSDENRAGLHGDIRFGGEVTYKDEQYEKPKYPELTDNLPKALHDAKFEMQNQETDYFPDSFRSQQYIRDTQLVKSKLFKSKYGFNQGFIKYVNHGMVDTGAVYDDMSGVNDEYVDDKSITLYLGRKLFIGEAFKDYKHVGVDINDFKEFIENKDLVPLFEEKEKEEDYKYKHFSRITRIEHEINLKGWYTEIGWGVDHLFHNQRYPDVQYPEAFAMMPGVNGIQLARVTEKNVIGNEVKSSVLIQLEPSGQNIKARILSFSTLPPLKNASGKIIESIKSVTYSIGDIVVIMFVNSSPDSAIVLGRVAMSESEVNEENIQEDNPSPNKPN
jgi:hypothetical protein